MSSQLIIERYPSIKDKSLLAKNASDELLLSYLNDKELNKEHIYIANDRFGFLTCNLSHFQPQILINFKSQEKAIKWNLSENKLPFPNIIFPLKEVPEKFGTALVKIPKSLELFKLFLYEIHKSISEGGVVLCGFMTKYFSPQFLSIANEFFESVEQTKAYKKSRLLVLKKKKEIHSISLVNELRFKDDVYLQYLGVFSASNIDYASQFFIENMQVNQAVEKALDLASGNGVLAKELRKKNPAIEVHLVDDFYLAVESSKMNLGQENTFYHFNDTLDEFEESFFDLVVSNPPFHFDFETNIDITFSLFKQVFSKLKTGGNFQLVANRHLPYKPFLDQWFKKVEVVAQNSKFIVYKCLK